MAYEIVDRPKQQADNLILRRLEEMVTQPLPKIKIYERPDRVSSKTTNKEVLKMVL